jgi:choice-of-anchor A domain-containing protein
MNVIKSLFVAVALLAIVGTSFATPVDLGQAGDYTLLSTGTTWYGNPLYGDMILGSAADVHGNVGARGLLNVGASAAINGDAGYGTLIMAPGASISGARNQQDNAFWNGLYHDLRNASSVALGETADKTYGNVIASSTIFDSQNGSVFDIAGLNLGAGDTLTLKGSAADQFIINVGDAGFRLGGNAAIVLDGVSSDNVLFNLYGDYPDANFIAAPGALAGTFIAPDGYFNLGDGLDFSDGARFLGAGMGANLQTIHPPSRVKDVPEPATVPLIVLGLICLGLMFMYRRRHC